MGRQYPIWHEITNCSYQGSKSYGNKNTGEEQILVGASSKNSHSFVETKVTRRQCYYKDESVIVFRYSVDGVVLKIMVFEDLKGKAGKLLETHSALNNVAGLSLEALSEGVKVED